MRARMYDARRDEDDSGVMRYGKPLQVPAGNGNALPPRPKALTERA
jgi:hypothetical protein